MATRRKTAPKPVELEPVIQTEDEALVEESFELVELEPEPEPEPKPEPAPATLPLPAPKPAPAARRRNVPRFTQVK